jgi:hypothetical protein
MRTNCFFLFFVSISVALFGAACGDDSSGDAGTDSGGDTSAPDTGTPDSSRPDTRPSDGGPDSSVELPVAECNPFGDDCAADEKCVFLIWNPDAESETDNTVFYGCVSNDTGTKSAGIICDRFVDVTPSDPSDVFVASDCAQGLFCWSTLEDSFERCRPMCGLEGAPECADEEEFCLTINSEPPLALCNPLSDCDPVTQAGCDAEDGCYIIGTTQGDLGARCFEAPTADDAGVPPPGRGDECMFINGCVPGHTCIGEILADGGTSDEALCRQFCEAIADGGTPFDAGADAAVPPSCMGTEACVGIPINSDGGTSLLPRPTGVCQ